MKISDWLKFAIFALAIVATIAGLFSDREADEANREFRERQNENLNENLRVQELQRKYKILENNGGW